jgi:AcrR family transcriptional regulator
LAREMMAMAPAPEQEADVSTGTAGDILEAAKTLFARHGYEGVRTREIAAEAGVTVGTIYKHFESKEALLQIIVNWAEAYLEPIMRAEAEQGDDHLLYRLTYRLVEFNLLFPREARISNEDYRSLAEPHLSQSIRQRRGIRHLIQDAVTVPEDTADDERRAMVTVLASTIVGMATAPKDWWHHGSRYTVNQTAHIYGRLAEQFQNLDPANMVPPDVPQAPRS